jgi:hypothetical protein
MRVLFAIPIPKMSNQLHGTFLFTGHNTILKNTNS